MAMNPICENCALYVEHSLMHEAMCEWVGMVREHAMEDLNYLMGIHDFAQRAIEAMEKSQCTSE